MLNKEDLIKLLVESREKYYTTGNTPLSDQEYDALEDHFKKIDPNHPFFDRSRATPSTAGSEEDPLKGLL